MRYLTSSFITNIEEFYMVQRLNTEKRAHKRYKAPEEAVLLNDGNVYRLLDVSSGGLCFRCLQSEFVPSNWSASILVGQFSLHIKDLPLIIVWEKPDNMPSFMSMPTKEVGVRYDDSDPALLEHINPLLQHYEFTEISAH